VPAIVIVLVAISLTLIATVVAWARGLDGLLGASVTSDGFPPTETATPPPDPASTPTDGRATEPSPATEEARGPLVIHHVGDVNLDHDVVPVFRRDGPDAAWDGVRDTFATAHLVLVNLECAATAGGQPQPKQYVFRCDLDSLPAMRAAGVDVANLANNHSGDYGIPGMVDSAINVEAAGMVAVGVGHNEEEAYRPRIIEVGGWRVAVLGFGGVVPTPDWTARGDRPGQATGYDAQRMAEAVAVAREMADVVVATVHWGEEGSFEPRERDRVKADAMIAAGADVVFGHHAHRLQPLEIVNGRAVFWNLGNFVWQRNSEAGAITAVGQWVIDPDGRTEACLLPFEIDTWGVPRPAERPLDCRIVP